MSPATNQLSSASYDANGNMTSGAGATLAYNVDNRLISAAETSGGIEYYFYAADGKRVWRQLANGTHQFTFYGAYGERLGVYTDAGAGCICNQVQMNVLFAGKVVWQGLPGSTGASGVVMSDRVGTNRNAARFYPFGDEITSTTNDRLKFATYTRDSYTGLDYANQRFYASTYGRFNTPDPSRRSAYRSNPLSWNRYMYALGDPVNSNDPTGLDDCDGTGSWNNSDDNSYGCVDYSNEVGSDGSGSDTGTVPNYTVTVNASNGFFNNIGSFLNTVTSNPYVQLTAAVISTGLALLPALEGNPGPLYEAFPGIEDAAQGILSTFENGQVQQVVTTSPTTVFRVFDGINSFANGQFWTTTEISSSAQATELLSPDPSFNQANQVITGVLQQGTTILTGNAAPNFGQPGGGNQTIIPNLPCISVTCVRALP